jgi:hypothetical protein
LNQRSGPSFGAAPTAKKRLAALEVLAAEGCAAAAVRKTFPRWL